MQPRWEADFGTMLGTRSLFLLFTFLLGPFLWRCYPRESWGLLASWLGQPGQGTGLRLGPSWSLETYEVMGLSQAYFLSCPGGHPVLPSLGFVLQINYVY